MIQSDMWQEYIYYARLMASFTPTKTGVRQPQSWVDPEPGYVSNGEKVAVAEPPVTDSWETKPRRKIT